jgi:hypothetical protein
VGRLRRDVHAAVADLVPVPAGAGERWDGDGTASAPGGMSADDAAIVRRIRERSSDGRYEGASDAELLELFQRNRRVLARSDEDVIVTKPFK